MQPIKEEPTLPRFTKEFIGIGHQLEQKRKDRRRYEQEERVVANRVLFLEKQQVKAQKSLIKKRQRLGQMVKATQRQAHQRTQRESMFLQRQKDIQIAREQNHLRRIEHRQNIERQESDVYRRNSYDYRFAKTKLIEGENKKKEEKREDLLNKQERYLTLNVERDQGRSKVDKFFKKKNFEHTMSYREKIMVEEFRASRKINTIEKLTEIEGVLRKKLEQSSQRVSQIDQALGNFEHSIRERSKSKSRLSLNRTVDHSPSIDNEEPSLITLVEGELLPNKNGSRVEYISDGVEGVGASEGGKMRSRRRNKHANRYHQYEQF